MSLVYFILFSVISKGGRDKEEVIFYLVLSMDEIVTCEREVGMAFRYLSLVYFSS
jgi:hypothetical protein